MVVGVVDNQQPLSCRFLVESSSYKGLDIGIILFDLWNLESLPNLAVRGLEARLVACSDPEDGMSGRLVLESKAKFQSDLSLSDPP